MEKETEALKQPSYWLKAGVVLDPAMQEAVEDYLVGVLGAGVEQAVDTPDGTLCLNVFFNDISPDESRQQELKTGLESHLQELAVIFSTVPPVITWEIIEDQDWSSNWKVHFKPFAIIPGLFIVPTWEDFRADDGDLVITMDPGMAFGTGHHATTSLALAFVRQIIREKGSGQRVLDVGTGTGILGMGAALLGASEVLGLDNDPDAVRIAGENVQLNRLEAVMTTAETAIEQVSVPRTLLVANIIHDVLIDMAEQLNRLLTVDGDLVLSGILHGEQEENIIRHYAEMGFVLHARAEREEWAALWLKRG